MKEILKYFQYAHLPSNLQVISGKVFEIVHWMENHLPECAEKDVGLRKLLEAKDCFIRAELNKTGTEVKQESEEIRSVYYYSENKNLPVMEVVIAQDGKLLWSDPTNCKLWKNVGETITRGVNLYIIEESMIIPCEEVVTVKYKVKLV